MATPCIASLGDACCGCGACEAVCPKLAVSMVEDSFGFVRPVVDESLCVTCGRCERACPACSTAERDDVLDAEWAIANDSELTERSSSGGVFGLIARHLLLGGGVVYGAAFTEDCRAVRHIRVDSLGELDDVMRSKYLQSRISVDVYRGVEADLCAGRRVLFSGTSCQVYAVRSYLMLRHVDMANLLLVDVICHGVPSPLLWRRWLEHVGTASGLEIDSVNFRSKSSGWETFSVAYYAGAEKVMERIFGDDWYMRAFLSNASLRPSCHKCSSKSCCGTDITLGDFWGVRSRCPEVPIDRGVSAVVIRTDAGRAAMNEIRAHCMTGGCSYEDIFASNPALERSAISSGRRQELMNALADGMPVEEMARRWTFKRSIAEKALSVLKRLLPSGFKSVVKRLLEK